MPLQLARTGRVHRVVLGGPSRHEGQPDIYQTGCGFVFTGAEVIYHPEGEEPEGWKWLRCRRCWTPT